MKKEIALISKNTDIINAVILALDDTSPIILSNFSNLKEVMLAKEVRIIVFDATNDSKEDIEDALLIIANNSYTPILLIVNEDFGVKLKAENINEMYWCINPCELTGLKHKLDKLKTATTTITRNLNLINTVMTKAPFGIGIIRNNDAKKSSYNAKMEELLGNDLQKILEHSYEYFSPSFPNDQLKTDNKMFGENPQSYSAQITKSFLQENGHELWVDLTISMIEYVDLEKFTLLVTAKDVGEEKVTKQALREMNRSRGILLNSMPGLAYRSKRDAFWTMEYMSDGALNLTGYTADEFVNNKRLVYNDIIVRKHREAVEKTLEKACQTQSSYEIQYEIKMKNKKKKWVLERGECVINEAGEAVAVEGVVFDIDEIKKLEKALKYKSEFDEGAHLPNLQSLIVRCSETPLNKRKRKTVITINLNEISRLTTTYGYNYMLDFRNNIVNKIRNIEVKKGALYLTQETQISYIFDRTLPEKEVQTLFEKIMLRTEGTLRREVIRCGVGVYFSADKNEDVELITNRALIASEYALRGDALLNLRYYDRKIEDGLKREAVIFKELQKVLEDSDKDNLYLHYQPIYLAKTMKIIAFEALARFKSPTYGNVPPLEFIPIAEKNRISIFLGRRIIFMAVSFMKRMHENGFPEGRVTINISLNHLLDWYFVIDMDRLINELNLDCTKITFEITEQIYEANYEKINNVVNELRKRGMRVAMDDFGTGFSSLGLLEQLNITTVKIDREFVKLLDHTTKKRSIIQDIVKMANRLGLAIVAEGVETKEQMEILTAFNCHMLQGYYFSRPIPEDDAFKLLVDNH